MPVKDGGTAYEDVRAATIASPTAEVEAEPPISGVMVSPSSNTPSTAPSMASAA